MSAQPADHALVRRAALIMDGRTEIPAFSTGNVIRSRRVKDARKLAHLNRNDEGTLSRSGS